MSSVHIQTAIKIRPFIEREKKDKLEPSWQVKDNSIIQIDGAKNFIGDPYSFDHIFDETHSNEHVYDAVVKPLVMSCFEGINSTIFAYGQTSSGKTHTMLGTTMIPGIINLAVQDIFSHIDKSSSTKFLLRCSYLEIYNEKINDLLDTNATDIKIREGREGVEGVYVVVKEEVVGGQAELFSLMYKGMKTRKISCTDMNERSSRSHTIFKLIIQSQDLHSEGSYIESALNLVDLAGSERVGQMNMEKERQVEGVSINKSLTTLGLVIRKLSENDSYINYRDSKLTRLLQHSLGGNSKTLIIANITTAALEETKSTLEFAQRAKYVKNQPIRNEKVTDKDQLKQYEQLCVKYKDQIEKLSSEKLVLEGKISNIELFSAKTVERKIKPPNRRHTFAFKPEKKLLFLKEPEESDDVEEDPFKQISPAKSELFFPVTHNAEDKENIFFEKCFTPPYKLARPSLPKTPGTPYSTLKQEKQCLEESLECLKSFTNHEYQYGNELDDLKELVDKFRQENFELRAELKDREASSKSSVDTQDIYEKLLLLKSILEVKPLQDTRRNSLNTIFEEEIDLFDGDIDSSITSNPIESDDNENPTNKIFAAIIEENKDLKWQLNEKERTIRGLKNDFNSEKLNIDAAFSKLNKSNEDLLKEIGDIKCENEKLKIKIAQDKDIKECELEIFIGKIKKLTDYKEELHKKLSEFQKSEVSSEDLTKINKEEWQNLKKEQEEIKLINEKSMVKIKELEEEIRILKNENVQKELEVAELEKSKEYILGEKNSLTEQIGQLKSELDDVMFSLSGEQKELEKVSQELEEKCQNTRSLEKQMEKYLNEYKKLSEELLKKDELLQQAIEEAKQNKEIELKLKSTREQFEEVSLELQGKSKELEQKSQQIAALEKLVFEQEQLEAENQKRLIKLDELFKDICEKDKSIENLQKTLSEQKTQNEVDHSEKEEAFVRLEQLVSKQEQLEAQNQEHLIKLNELTKDIRNKDESIETLQKTVSELKAQNQVNHSERKEAVIRLEQLVFEKGQLEAQNQECSIKLNELSEYIRRKDEIIDTLQNTVSELKAQNEVDGSERKETITSLQKTIEDMKEDKEIENYQVEIKTEMKQLETFSLELQEKSRQLEEKSEDISVLERQISELKAQNQMALLGEKETIETLQKKIEDMKQHKEQEKKLSELETQNKIELLRKEETIKILQTKIEDMKQNEEIKKYQQELVAASEKLETFSSKLHENRKQLKEKSEDIAELEKKLSELEAQSKTELLEKEKNIENLQKKIEDMKQNEEIKEYQQESAAATEKLEKLSSKLHEKRRQLKEKSEAVAELEKKLSDWESQNKIELLRKEETIKALQTKIEDMKQNEEIEKHQQELSTAMDQLETLSFKLNEKNEQLKEKSGDVADLEKKLSELESQNKIELVEKEKTIEILQKKMDMKQDEEIKKYQQELATAMEKLETLSFKFGENSKQLKEKSEDVAKLENNLSELESVNKIQLIEKEKSIQILQEKTENMKQTIDSLKKLLEDGNKNKEVENYKLELKTLTEKFEGLSEEQLAKSEKIEEKSQLLAQLKAQNFKQVNKLHEDLSKKEETIKSLQKKLSEWESQNKIELLRKEETFKALQAKIEDLKQNEEITKYQQELSTTMDQLETLSFKLNEKKEQLKEKSGEVAELEKKLSELESQNKIELAEKEKTIEILQKKMDMKQDKEIKKYQQELTTATEKLEILSFKFGESIKQLKEKSEDNAELEKKLAELDSQYKIKLLENEDTIEILQKKLEDMKQNEEIKKYQQELAAAMEKLETLSFKFGENRKQLKEKSEDVAKLEKNLSELESVNKIQLIEKEKSIQILQEKIENMKQTIDRLQKLLEDGNKNKEVENYKLELKTMTEKFEGLSEELLAKSEKIEEKSQLLAQLKAQNFKQVNKLHEELSKKEETIESLQKKIENMKQNTNTQEIKLLKSKLLDYENRLIEKNKLFELVSLESEKWEALHKEDVHNFEGLSKNLLGKSKMVEKLQKELETLKENYHLELTTIKKQIKHYEETELDKSKLKNTTSKFMEKEKTKQVELNLPKLEELEALKREYTDKLAQFEKVTNENADLKKQLSKMKENLVNKSWEIEKLSEQINKLSQNETSVSSYQIFGNDSTSQLEEIKHIKKDLNEKLHENTKLNEEKRKLQEMVQELNKSGLEKKRRLKEHKDKYHSLELQMAKTNKDLFIKEQDLVKEKSSNRKLEQQLSALQKKIKHEPETPTEKPSRHSGDGRVSPKELRKIKRHSLLEQRRGISSEFAMLDNDFSDSECTNCKSIKKKYEEMSVEIDTLKEDNKYLDKENEDMLREVDWLKEERLRIISALDQNGTSTGLLNLRLDVAPPHHKVDKGTQATCDYHQKYNVLKKIAELRREEGNYLRKKLNLPVDCPVLPTDIDGHQWATTTM